jgi:hypothetical protein
MKRTSVTRVANRYLGVPVDEVWNSSRVVGQSITEEIRTELTVTVDTGMEFEAVVFALPIVAGTGVASGGPMEFPPEQGTDLNDGAVHEAQLSVTHEQAVQNSC